MAKRSEAKMEESKEERSFTFGQYVDLFLSSMHIYTKAYLGAMYRGQSKKPSEWGEEPEIAKLLKKE